MGASGDKRRIKRVTGAPGDSRDTGVIGDLQQEHKSTWGVRAGGESREPGGTWGAVRGPLRALPTCAGGGSHAVPRHRSAG